ncbi:MAG: DNA integrity scanning protein DisA nucleotide-binding domain protein [Planctomycetaceae bacterium]|nr:DNA integrity scanning protein DisA nucleotide-binding domain protein [Planctomycetaceae bacterium]MCA9030790.1 DNA integrity scanning protein DisA nucleotide-binding domain protein [Planctomycetaceae bacterium]MCB9954150.1 DNA integrity scanning protein DisA nucleotide-binding domain protein [Planctomycetaceae bacterium]
MTRDPVPATLVRVLQAARVLAKENEAAAVLILSEAAYDFSLVQKEVGHPNLIVASHIPDVQEAAKQDEIEVIALSQEPQTRHMQVSQALLDAIADDLVQTGARVVAVYSGFDREAIDTVSLINLSEHLAKLTTRDLQRLETQVPLPLLRRVVDLAVEVGREGREGKKVGTMFVVGHHRKVLELSHEGVHDPFRGYSRKERMVSSSRVRESVKELAQIDGAFIISNDGCVMAAGRILDAPPAELTLSKGLGARHWAAASISKATNAVCVTVSESTGTVRIFQNGVVVLRIEPMLQAMKWHDVDTEPPAEA